MQPGGYSFAEGEDGIIAAVPISGDLIPDDAVAGDALTLENDIIKATVDANALALTIENKRTGYVWNHDMGEGKDLNKTWKEFAAAGVSIVAGIKGKNTKQSSFTGKAKLTKSNDSITASIKFKDFGVSMDVEYRLDGDSLRISVPFESIKETKAKPPQLNKLQSITLYPFMGASYGQSDGFILIPDGCGAVIDLSKKTSATQPWSAPVYGDDLGFYGITALHMNYGIRPPEPVAIPVYGIGYGTDALMSHLGSGAERAELMAYSAGIITPYNWACASFVYRDFYYQFTSTAADFGNSVPLFQDKPNQINPELYFTVLDGDDASCSGMAARTKERLLNDGILNPLERRSGEAHITLLMADNEKGLMGRKTVETTTVSQAREITDSVRDMLEGPLRMEVTGYDKKGLTSHPVRLGALQGKTGEWREFISDYAGTDDSLYFLRDYVQVYKHSRGFTGRDTALGISQQFITMNFDKEIPPPWDVSKTEIDYDYYRFLKPEATGKNFDRDIKRLNKLGVTGISFSTMGRILNSTYGKRPNTREEVMREYAALLDEEGDFNYGLHAPGDYLWRCSDVFFDMPLKGTGYLIAGEPTPFLQMILSGCVELYGPDANDQPTYSEYPLKLLEYGMKPSWLLTGVSPSMLKKTYSRWIATSEWRVLKSRIEEQYDFMREGSDATSDKALVDHRKIEDGVYQSIFTGGVVLTVNYNRETRTVDGISVPGEGYTIGREDAE